jgi:hypothetical protein
VIIDSKPVEASGTCPFPTLKEKEVDFKYSSGIASLVGYNLFPQIDFLQCQICINNHKTNKYELAMFNIFPHGKLGHYNLARVVAQPCRQERGSKLSRLPKKMPLWPAAQRTAANFRSRPLKRSFGQQRRRRQLLCSPPLTQPCSQGGRSRKFLN